MRVTLFLTLLIGAFAATTDNSTLSNLALNGSLIGTWYMAGVVDGYELNISQCCIPYGTIVFTPDTANTNQTYMTSDVWTGDLCETYGIDSTYIMTVALPWNVPFSDLFYAEIDSRNSLGIEFYVADEPGYSSYWGNATNWPNGTQEVEIDFFIRYPIGIMGEECAIIMSMDTSPVSQNAINNSSNNAIDNTASNTAGADASSKAAFHYGVSGVVLILLVSFMSMF